MQDEVWLYFSKFKEHYCVIVDFLKGVSSEPLDIFFIVVKWTMVRSTLILQYIIYFCTQFFIDFTNEFYQAYIPRR